MRQLDEALLSLGWRGKYHLMLFAVAAAITIRDPWPLLSIAFSGQHISHHCKLPLNSTVNVSIPVSCSDGCTCQPDECSIFLNGSTNVTVPCPDGWEYSSKMVSDYYYDLNYETSIVMEWDLVCDRSYLLELSTTIFMTGVLVGSLLSQLADKFGRKQVLLVSLWFQGAVGVITAFATDYVQFSVARFVIGAVNQVTMLVGFVYIIEAYPASSRTKPGILVQVFWGVGVAAMAPIAYLFKNWRYFQIAISAPVALFIPLHWYLPESVCWLVSKGKITEAEQVLQKAAKINGISLPKNCLSAVQLTAEIDGLGGSALATDDPPTECSSDYRFTCRRSKSEAAACGAPESRRPPVQHTILDLLGSPIMRRYTIILFSIWFVESLNYVALSLSMTQLYGNKYVNFFIGGIVEIPAYLMAAALSSRFGRKLPLLAFSVVCGISSILVAVLPASGSHDCDDDTLDIIKTSIAMLGKFGVTGSYAILIVLSPEIFPTSIRNLGLGLCSVFDNIGGMSAPLVIMAGHHIPWLPNVALGILVIVGNASVFWLPTTHHRSLPTEVKEVEAWSKEDAASSVVCPKCCSAASITSSRKKIGVNDKSSENASQWSFTMASDVTGRRQTEPLAEACCSNARGEKASASQAPPRVSC